MSAAAHLFFVAHRSVVPFHLGLIMQALDLNLIPGTSLLLFAADLHWRHEVSVVQDHALTCETLL